MSAALAWDLASAETSSVDWQPSRPHRPTLQLVPGSRGDGSRRTGRPLVRVSRFGRLALTLVAATMLSALASILLGVGAADAGIDHRVVVHSGQTLSEVAAAELPQLSLAEGVAQIQLANGMNTSQVHAGQELAIPTVG